MYRECKFCLDTINPELMFSPCKCAGSLEFVHKYCLDYYHLEHEDASSKCSICGYHYQLERKLNFDQFYKLFIRYLILFFNTSICIFTCFNQNIYYFFKISLFLYLFGLFFKYNNFYKYNIKFKKNSNIFYPNISEYNYKFLLKLYKTFLFHSNLILIVFKSASYFNLINYNLSVNLFKSLYIIVTVIHFINLVYYLYDKSVYKKIIQYKNIK